MKVPFLVGSFLSKRYISLVDIFFTSEKHLSNEKYSVQVDTFFLVDTIFLVD